MPFLNADRVWETSTSTGTGSFTLAGAVPGYQTFDSAYDTSDTTYYTIAEQAGSSWEVGIGTFTAPSTLARTTIISSSNGGSIVTFGAGTKNVFVSLPGSRALTTNETQTISSKRIDPRVSSVASASSVTPDISSFDAYVYTALAAGLTINATTGGTPLNGNRLIFRFKDNGTSRALSWTISGSNSFRAVGVTLPTATVINKVTYVGCIYNSAESFWDVVAVTTQA